MPLPTLHEIQNNKELETLWLNFLDKTSSLKEYIFTRSDFPPQKTWETYISSKSKHQANVPGALQKAAQKLADANDFSPASWQHIIAEAKKAVLINIVGMIDAFVETEAYMIYRANKAIPKYKKMFGIKNSDTLRDLLVAQGLHKKTEAVKIAEKLIKQEKLEKVTVSQLITGIKML